MMVCVVGLMTFALNVALSLPVERTTRSEPEHLYMACYKPAMMLCSWEDDTKRGLRKNRPARLTLANLQGLPSQQFSPEMDASLHLVGRLDRDSEGLLLLTTNGSFTAQVLSQDCAKTYWALVEGYPSNDALQKMREGGLNIRGATTRPPLSVQRLDDMTFDPTLKVHNPDALPPPIPSMRRPGTWLQIVLNEGRNRQVRKITASAGHQTLRLCRVAIGNLSLDPSWDPAVCYTIPKSSVLEDV